MKTVIRTKVFIIMLSIIIGFFLLVSVIKVSSYLASVKTNYKLASIKTLWKNEQYVKIIQVSSELLENPKKLTQNALLFVLESRFKSYYYNNQHNKSLDDIKEYISLDSTNFEPFLYKAKILQHNADYDQADKIFRKSLDIKQSKLSYTNYFKLFEVQGLIPPKDLLNKAISWDSLFYDAYYYRGLFFKKEREYDKALNDFISIEKDPKKFTRKRLYPMVYFNLVEYYINQRDFDAALKYCNKSISLSTFDKHDLLYGERALINYKLKNYKKSIDDLTIVLSFDSYFMNIDTIALLLSYIYFIDGNKANSDLIFTKFIENGGDIEMVRKSCRFLILDQDEIREKLTNFYNDRIQKIE